jgi:archaellum component FlaC
MPKDLSVYSKDELESAMGSTFILGNNSYSGADIKVVVHSYGDESTIKNELIGSPIDVLSDPDMQVVIEELATKLLETQNELAITYQKLSQLHRNTSERDKLQTHYNRLQEQEKQIKDSVEEFQQRASDLNKFGSKDTKQGDLGTPQISTKVLADVQTLSVSIFRDKQAVRSFGSVYPKSFSRDQREIGGTLVFTVFDKHVLYEFLSAHITDFDHSAGITSVLLDQMPPVDITVAFANEYGSISRMALLGVEFVDEGQVMSIEDIITENTVSFVARDIDPMRSVTHRLVDEQSRLLQTYAAKRASDLIMEEDYQATNIISPFVRHKKRRNPFI